ncbi:MAG TPA: WYL domain-containing protein, partial [Mycobacterium sp.]
LNWNSSDSPVEPDVLMTLARACRDREHVSASYVDRAGNATDRRLEPYQLVTTGKRWYLLAFDRDRQDWRSLRLDRMHDVSARGSTFVAREAPDAAGYVRRSISASPYLHVARVRYFAPEEFVAQHFSPSSVTIEADGPDACVVTAGADDPERMVFYFATVGADFEVLEPPEVARAVEAAAGRLRRAAIRP